MRALLLLVAACHAPHLAPTTLENREIFPHLEWVCSLDPDRHQKVRCFFAADWIVGATRSVCYWQPITCRWQ